MSAFAAVESAPPIEIFKLNQTCKDDPHPKKVNLTVGAYRDDAGQPWVLPVVRQVQEQLAKDPALDKEYLPITGLPQFCQAAARLVLGDSSPALAESRADAVQTLGGTGSLRLAGDFYTRVLQRENVLLSNPTWGNHKLIFKHCGFKNQFEYRYWRPDTRSVDWEGMVEDLMNAPDESLILLHGVAHNPTGCDPTRDQWVELSALCKKKRFLPLFDIAYQGFASGDVDQDAWAIRRFVEDGHEVLIAQSFSKNFGLYNERVGALTFVLGDSSLLAPVKSQLAIIIRANWSNPPSTGCRIVSSVLNNAELTKMWRGHLTVMSSRIQQMRQQLYQKLKDNGTPGTWNHIIEQIGMFSYTGLNREQVEHLRKVHHIYMITSGRISMCGITPTNVDYVADAIDDAVRNVAA